MDSKDRILIEKILSNQNKIEALLLLKERPFLSFNEAVEYTKIPAATLRGYCSKGLLSYHRVRGRRVFFDVDTLNKFILNELNRHKSEEEIKEEALLLSAEL